MRHRQLLRMTPPHRSSLIPSLIAQDLQSEAAFQSAVVEFATLCGWEHYHPYDSRKSRAGYPDLTLWRDAGEFILAELKRQGGRTTLAQEAIHESLRRAGQRVYVWRPSDWPEIETVLGSRR